MSWFGKIRELKKHLSSLNPDEEYMLVKKPKKPPKSRAKPPPKSRAKPSSPKPPKSRAKPSPPKYSSKYPKYSPKEEGKKDDGFTVKVKIPHEKSLAELEKTARDKWFEKKMQSVMKDNAMKRLIPGRKFGDLDHKRLHKILTSDRLFMRADSLKGKEYSTVLVVDKSGSMRNEKEEMAATCIVKLIPVLEKYSSVAVIAFDEAVRVFKKFNEKVTDFPELHRTLIRRYASGNHDHAGIREARKMLEKQKGRKIILTLSDGEPACVSGCLTPADCGNYRFQEEMLHKEIHIAEMQGIKTIGIGIYSDAVEIFYKQNIVINNLNDLYDGMVRELSKLVWRGV